MAGIYIHIPFCKTRCSYCDFYTQTDTKHKDTYVDAVCKELILRKDYLNKESVQTIYFGGGTPSLLSLSDFEKIFETINRNYSVNDNNEITLEANPDDLNDSYVSILRKLPFNRISIGIQSFDDKELKFLDRRHTGTEAENAVKRCREAGFNNISIDLMYGLPNQTLNTWESNLQKAVNLNIQHISSYHLIYEEGTKMHKLVTNGTISTLSEGLSIEMFSLMNNYLKEKGFMHYEISNFAQKGFFSRHNSSYWTGDKYLGIGASAHSFNGESRSWNIASITDYIRQATIGTLTPDIEFLSLSAQYNDYILTRMRTMWGANFDEIEKDFGEKYADYCMKNARKYLESKDVEIRNRQLLITEKGLFISDSIMSDLMYID